MQRHFSDTTAFAPRQPSGLGPNRTSRGLPLGTAQRGTVSMPTSPLMMMHRNHSGVPSGSVNAEDIWNLPHSAQDFFALPPSAQGPEQPSSPQIFPEHVSPFDIAGSSTLPPQTAVPWYSSDTSGSPINPFPPSQLGGPDSIAMPHSHNPTNGNPLGLGLDMQMDMDQVMEDGQMTGFGFALEGGEEEGMGPGGRKKRAQVRVACTHCQKACKKCSNTRPCERCTKYGLKDCIDSTRKPRKTGIKRGPYKRRASKYVSSQEPESYALATLSHPYTVPHPHRPQHNQAQPPANHGLNHNHTHGHVNGNANANAHTGHQAPFPLTSNLHSPSLPPPQPPSAPSNAATHQPQPPTPGPSAPPPPAPAPTQGYPPGPRATPASLTQALSAALTGPRWVNGQRVAAGAAAAASASGAGSGAAGAGAGAGVGATTGASQAPNRPSPLYPKTPVGPFPISLGSAGDPFSRAVSPIRQFAYPSGIGGSSVGGGGGGGEQDGKMAGERQQQKMGQQDGPGGLRSARPTLSINTTVPTPTTGSFPYPQNPAHRTHQPSPSPGPGPGTFSPFYQLPSKIRKPSLRTLMSATSSREPSPEVVQSPTLFNQPMMLDEGLDMDIVGMQLNGWAEWGEGGAGRGGGEGGEGAKGREKDGREGEGQSTREGSESKHGETDGGASARTLEGMGFSGFEGLMGFHT
ncbi:hypothetical protein IAT38_002214 [Cryptococcus sp. DSM 104549]